MPELVKLQKELEDSGFVIIANHVQSVDRETVTGYVKSVNANFTVTSQSGVDVPGKGNGIPRAFLFNSKGELVSQGHPIQMKQTILELVASEPHWLAAGREYKHIARLADALKKVGARGYGAVMKRLAKSVESSDEEEKAEAEYLLGRLRSHGNEKLEAAKALESQNALAAMEAYNEVAVGFKGDELGDQAKDRMKELKGDKEFQTELKASQIAAEIRKTLDTLVYVEGKVNLESAHNKRVARKAQQYFAALSKKFPDARATASVKEELSKLGIALP